MVLLWRCEICYAMFSTKEECESHGYAEHPGKIVICRYMGEEIFLPLIIVAGALFLIIVLKGSG